MPEIFDEARMLEVLGRSVPEGETLSAGVHGVTLQVNKKKTSVFDVYIGITDHYFIVEECEERKYLSAIYHIPDLRKTVAEDAGVCFPLAELRSCTIKNAIMGAVNCALQWNNGCFLKLQLPKRGGLGGGMPHHAEYREKILARLESLPCCQGVGKR